MATKKVVKLEVKKGKAVSRRLIKKPTITRKLKVPARDIRVVTNVKDITR